MVAITAIIVVAVISAVTVGVLSFDMYLLNKERMNIKTVGDKEEFDRKLLYRSGPSKTPLLFGPHIM